MLRAVDELHSDAWITDGAWAVLAADLDERQLIEVPILVGQSFAIEHPGAFRRPRNTRMKCSKKGNVKIT